MSVYVPRLKSAILPDMWVANTDYPAGRSNRFNATAGNNIGDGVFKDHHGNIYEIKGNIFRWLDNATGRWGAWQLNPKYEEFTGHSKRFNANSGGDITYKRIGHRDTEGNITFGPWIEVGLDKTSNFTGDTGGTLNWQIGMEDPPYFGLFGNKKKKEAGAREDAMRDARNDHPAVTNCQACVAGIASVRAHIASTEQSMQDGSTSATVGPRYLEAYNTILQEYINYFNTNCIAAAPPTPLPTVLLPPTPNGGPTVNQDPITQTVLPGNNTPPSQTGTGTVPPGNNGTIQQTITIPSAAKKFSVPKWAWYAGGGLVALTVIILLIKNK